MSAAGASLARREGRWSKCARKTYIPIEKPHVVAFLPPPPKSIFFSHAPMKWLKRCGDSPRIFVLRAKGRVDETSTLREGVGNVTTCGSSASTILRNLWVGDFGLLYAKEDGLRPFDQRPRKRNPLWRFLKFSSLRSYIAEKERHCGWPVGGAFHRATHPPGSLNSQVHDRGWSCGHGRYIRMSVTQLVYSQGPCL